MNTQFLALKENCVATLLKLYLNKQYQNITSGIFKDE